MDRAAEVSALGKVALKRFEEKHRAREVTIRAARLAIQCCAASIRATHRGEWESATQLAAEAQGHLNSADEATAGFPEVRSNGPLQDAKKELAEACITLALVRDEPLPTPDDLGVESAAYLNGMAEAASELRREILDLLRGGNLHRAESLMAAMDDIYSVLVTVDYPDAVTAGLRRTTDALRAVLERTRGDLTTTIVAARLQASIDAERADRNI